MEELIKLAEKVVNNAKEKGLIIALAESCTGGLASYAITSVPGSSAIFDRAFITYSYESKSELLGVSRNLLMTEGAVNEQCVEEMAIGTALRSRANITVSISGVAGPEGEPLGLVYLGCFNKKGHKIRSEKQTYRGDRNSIRIQASKRAMELLLSMLNEY